MKISKRAYVVISISVVCSCRKFYAPPIVASPGSYLVVEGMINTGSDSSVIKLSRTVPVSSQARSTPELGATLAIISDAGSTYPLTEAGKGFYKAAGLNINSSTAKYCLKIITSGSVIYQSDFVPAKISPPIDSVYYKIKSDGLQLYADTHDPTNNTRYYRWDYQSTYEFHSAYESVSYLQTVPIDSVMDRSFADRVYVCWRSDTSSTILINTSAKLAKDIISQNPITYISSTAEELENRYSILVKQYAISADAYNYYTQLKKNTEQLGGVFDPQPSQLPGNVHCTSNPAEPVLGFITAGAAAQSRIYINSRDLPAWLVNTPYKGCRLDTDLYNRRLPNTNAVINEVETTIYSGMDSPIYPYKPDPRLIHPLGYVASSPFCVDCTFRGTTKRPDFWTEQ